MHAYKKRNNIARTLAPFMFILLIFSIGASADDPILSRFVEGMVSNPFIIGILVSISWISFTIASEPAGSIIDKIGTRRALLLGGAIEAASVMIVWLAHSVYIFAIAMALAGIGSSFFWTSSRTYTANVSRRRTGIGFGTYVATWGLGWAIGPLIGGVLADVWEIRAPFLLGAILLTISLLIFRRFLPADKKQKRVKKIIAYELHGGFLQDGLGFLKIAPIGVKRIFFLQMLMYFALEITLIFAPLYFIQFSNAEIGVLFFMQSIIFALGSFLWGVLADRTNKAWFVIIGFLATGVAIWFLLNSTSFLYAFLFMGMLGLTLALIEPITDAMLNDRIDHKVRGVANGLSQAAYGIGGGVGPILGGAVAELYGIPNAFVLSIIFCIIGAAICLSIRK